MTINELVRDFAFLGYDVRRIKNPLTCKSEVSKIVSIDQKICERPDSLLAFDWAKVGKTQSEWGQCLDLRFAKEIWEKLPNKNEFDIFAFFLRRDFFFTALQKEYIYKENEILLEKNRDYLHRLEGFDIATLQYEWISYLTNCGRDIKTMFPQIKLNSVFLIDTIDDAEKIKAFAENDIPEHNPFGIWSIWSVS